jgi:hypothetical protein
MSNEEIIKPIEEWANKLGININLSYDLGSGQMRNDARRITGQRSDTR